MISRLLGWWCRHRLPLPEDGPTALNWPDWEHISTESLGLGTQEKLQEKLQRFNTEIRQGNSSTTSVNVSLPIETWHRIIDFAMICFNEHTEKGEFSMNRPKMSVLIGLASASKFHRRIVLESWAHTFLALEHQDPVKLRMLEKSNQAYILSNVRRLVCGDEYKIYQAPVDALRDFNSLVELIIDGHSDIDFGDERRSITAQVRAEDGAHYHTQQQSAVPRMAYRRLKVTFPNTLQVLRVYDSHVPDLYLIQKAARECPELQTLTLARCTLFTRAGCTFWHRLPCGESDAYFSNHKVADYAAAVGKALSQLPALKAVQIGVYLTDHAAIKTHVEQHAGLDALGSMHLSGWKKPCDLCAALYQNATNLAEKEATGELAKAVPHLTQVSWLSFCSDTRTSWHTQHILRDEDGGFTVQADSSL